MVWYFELKLDGNLEKRRPNLGNNRFIIAKKMSEYAFATLRSLENSISKRKKLHSESKEGLIGFGCTQFEE